MVLVSSIFSVRFSLFFTKFISTTVVSYELTVFIIFLSPSPLSSEYTTSFFAQALPASLSRTLNKWSYLLLHHSLKALSLSFFLLKSLPVTEGKVKRKKGDEKKSETIREVEIGDHRRQRCVQIKEVKAK